MSGKLYQQEYYQKHRERKIQYQKTYYRANKERITAQSKEYRKLHKDTRAPRHWERLKLGITPIKFTELLKAQNGTCAICQQVVKRWHLDHNHFTHKVRGILCGNCNTGLGFLKDSADICRSAAKYLTDHS